MVAIEESKNLEEMQLEELQGSLEAHHQRLSERQGEKAIKQALFVKNTKRMQKRRRHNGMERRESQLEKMIMGLLVIVKRKTIKKRIARRNSTRKMCNVTIVKIGGTLQKSAGIQRN